MKKEIKITCQGAATLPLDNLIEFQGELKNLSKENYQKLKKEILELGFSEPISVWKHGNGQQREYRLQILNGHQRVRTLRQMREEGFEVPELPVNFIEAKDEEEAKRKVLALTSQYGEITHQGLYEFISEAEISFEEMQNSFRFPEVDFDKFEQEFVKDAECTGDEDEVPEPPVEPKTRFGDLYTLGNHRVLCGDSTKKEDVERLMNGEKADMVFTSPPYNAGTKITTRPRKYLNSDDQLNDFVEFLNNFTSAWISSTKYLWVNLQTLSNNMHDIVEWLYAQKNYLAEIAVWRKTNPPPSITENLFSHAFELIFVLTENRRGRTVGKLKRGELSNVFESSCNSNSELSGVHNAGFPLALVENFLKTSTGNLIGDSFLGTGTTLIACEKTNRRCFGMEIDPAYCDVIVSRWEKFTGKKAVKNA